MPESYEKDDWVMEYQTLYQNFQKERRLKFFSFGLLTVLSLSLLISLIALSSKKDHVVVVPAMLNQSVSFKENGPSLSYIEEFSAYFGHLFLDITPENINFHHQLILKYVTSSAFESLSAALKKESTHIKQERLSTAFKLIEIETKEHPLSAQLRGYLSTYVGGHQVSNDLKTYQIQYQYQFGKLLITSFQEILGE